VNAIVTRAAGAPVRLTAAFDFSASKAPDRISLQYIRASGLAQTRLQLAVLSGNRRGALREIDRLVEIDRQLERLATGGEADSAELSGECLSAHLTNQQQAIAGEKLALVAAVEFPRMPARPRQSEELLLEDGDEIVVVEDSGLGSRLGRIAILALVVVIVVAALAIAVPLLASG
jgi:hypothetical protein